MAVIISSILDTLVLPTISSCFVGTVQIWSLNDHSLLDTLPHIHFATHIASSIAGSGLQESIHCLIVFSCVSYVSGSDRSAFAVMGSIASDTIAGLYDASRFIDDGCHDGEDCHCIDAFHSCGVCACG